MLRTRVIVCVLAGLAGTAIAAPPALHAAKGEHGKWADSPLGRLITGDIGRWLVLKSELNVTADQKAKIQAAVKAKKPEIAAVAKGVWEKRTALVNAVLADSPDEAAIRRAADDLGKAIGDTAVLASKVAGEVKPVLTSDQREKIEKFRQDCQQATDKFFEKATKGE